MLPGPATGDVGVVDPLVVQMLVGDRVVLDSGVHAMALGVHVRTDVVERQVETDVAIEVAVVRVAGIAFLRAPHLLRRLGVTSERRHAAPAVERRVDAEDRSVVGELDPVAIDEEITDGGLA